MADYSETFIKYALNEGYDLKFIEECLSNYLDVRRKHFSHRDFLFYLKQCKQSNYNIGDNAVKHYERIPRSV